MKITLKAVFAATLLSTSLSAQEVISYLNLIRQYQTPANVSWDAFDDSSAVAANGSRESALAINPGGATFKLATIKSSSLTGLSTYQLASTYVGTYVPAATVVIRSEDTTSEVPRTRADRPFSVDVRVDGIRTGLTDPEESKKVTFYRHVQSYGSGTGVNLDRTQALLMTQSTIDTIGTQTLAFAVNSVPGANRAKVRGEERFSVFSVDAYQSPPSQLASQYIQIWPVADGTLSGITPNQLIRFTMPDVTIALNDLYPSSTSYAQVYKGAPQLGKTGTIVPGSSLVISESVPQNRVLKLEAYDKSFTSDGVWTMEVLTQTPFGIDRLAYVSFVLDRTMEVNSTVTTID